MFGCFCRGKNAVLTLKLQTAPGCEKTPFAFLLFSYLSTAFNHTHLVLLYVVWLNKLMALKCFENTNLYIINKTLLQPWD